MMTRTNNVGVRESNDNIDHKYWSAVPSIYSFLQEKNFPTQLVKTRSCRQLWHVKRAILSKILSICLSLQFGISYSSKCCLKKSKTDFIWYDILSVYTGCCHASSSQMQIINQYWAIPEKNTNRGGGRGG